MVRLSANKSHGPPEALCFDLDETLLDGSRFAESVVATCAALADAVPTLDRDQLIEANNAAFAKLSPETIDDWTLGHITGRDLSMKAWMYTLQASGHLDDELVDLAVSTHLICMRDTYQLFDDARALVATASKLQLPCALITNGASDTQREKLDALNLLEWFDTLIISGERGIAKPDASLFRAATDALGVTEGACWHIGDNLIADVGGAQAAGLIGVWINRHNKPRSDVVVPDIEVRSLSDLNQFLDH